MQTVELPEQLLKLVDVARVLNVSKSTAYRLAQTGELPAVHFAGSVRVTPQDLAKFILENRKNGEHDDQR